MDQTEHSIATTDPLAPRSAIACKIDMATVREMDMEELHGLRDALHTISEVTQSLYCQPRFTKEAGPYDIPRDNKAGKLLGILAEWLSGYEDAVVNVVRASQPLGESGMRYRARVLISHEAEFCDDFESLSELANKLAADLRSIKFPEAAE